MTATTYTNSSLATARSCLTKYHFRYNLRLERDTDEEREPLAVGQAWHRAHDAGARGGPEAAYASLARHAPSPLWREKLARLYAAQEWYWQSQPFDVLEPERTFNVELKGRTFEGQMDGIVRLPDGRVGVLERKTTGDSVDAESSYWSRLQLDTQVGIYALAFEQLRDAYPDFILYDVVRKPTIRPKSIVKADAARLEAELKKSGAGSYYGELFDELVLRPALDMSQESIALYGARLTAAIGDEPAYYFARRNVPRTRNDYKTLLGQLGMQVNLLEFAQSFDAMFRNPDACATFGLCEFFPLCSANITPTAEAPVPNPLYRQREHTHPELVREND